MKISAKRISISPVHPIANQNIYRQYPIQDACWIGAVGVEGKADAFLEFELGFELEEQTELTLHVSGDQRFELFCDGAYLAMGPDRSDLHRWSFHSYELILPAGPHHFTAQVVSIANQPPEAQIGHHPSFILAAEGSNSVILNTGKAPWRVRHLGGIETYPNQLRSYHVVGPNMRIHADSDSAEPHWEKPITLAFEVKDSPVGLMRTGWRLLPSRLPEQIRREIKTVGRIRMVQECAKDDVLAESDKEVCTAWQALITRSTPVVVPSNSRITVLWDLEEYHCAYPFVTLSGGRNAEVEFEWAEACYEVPDDNSTDPGHVKGNRNVIAGKLFQGCGDTFVADGSQDRTLSPCWWRAGRYIRLHITTEDEALTINRIRLFETRFPLENEGQFKCDDSCLQAVIPLLVRGIQMCAHETYMDCPYYEQLMYVGDTRLQALTTLVMSRDDRLILRAIELFDWSRHVTGFVLERHPSRIRQLSTTFSMIWILMLHDLAWWRDHPEFVREHLVGMRSLLEEFRYLLGPDDLFTGLPGWSFIDWVKEPHWEAGMPPEGRHGKSAACNLLFLLALTRAAELEKAFGEAHFADSYQVWAERMGKAIKATFWNEDRGLFADDLEHQYYSEHAQCLALLSRQFDASTADRCFDSLISATDLARATVYFSHYLLDVFQAFGRGDLIVKKLEFWKKLPGQGFKTPVERPEPSRSDCHAWGAHPLFHMHASLCGIRPVAPRFSAIEIRPQPGGLTTLESVLPHPKGVIEFNMTLKGRTWDVCCQLPEGVPGTLLWQGIGYPLSGHCRLLLTA